MAARCTTFAAGLGLSTLLAFSGDASAQQQDSAAEFAALGWQIGPTKGELGGVAAIIVPEGYKFVGRGGAGKFMELAQNPSDGSELGVLLPSEGSWFVVFEFSAGGYVKDDDRDLDADAILSAIRESTEQANTIRRERGWPPVNVVGWQQRPFYEPRTNNLTWAINGSSEGSTSVNRSTRLLGRRGVMKVNLVLSPEELGTALPALNSLLTGLTFNPGQRYAEFTRGDKVAEYGLTGLIVGGTGVTLVKTGLLQKFWKLIVVGFIALAGAIKRLFTYMRPRGEVTDQRSNV